MFVFCSKVLCFYYFLNSCTNLHEQLPTCQRIREEKREERRRRESEKKRLREDEKRKRREEERRKRKEAEKQKKIAEKEIRIKVTCSENTFSRFLNILKILLN